MLSSAELDAVGGALALRHGLAARIVSPVVSTGGKINGTRYRKQEPTTMAAIAAKKVSREPVIRCQTARTL